VRRHVRPRLPQLLRNPKSIRISGDVEAQDLSPVVTDDEETVQDAKCERGYSEEVHGGDCLTMVPEERQPVFGGIRGSGSPYNRIDLVEIPPPAGWTHASAFSLVANHSRYQWLVDLSPEFLKRYPQAEPNRLAVPYYELPYTLVPHAKNVLILGAGTGNDVAGALRHGAEHIDAIGRKHHPEHPYDSPRVAAYTDDARSFLKKTKTKYDLIVFAFLDSTTLLSSFSSLRLDNYVYTVESFQNAKAVLTDHQWRDSRPP
jgi:hypothetical protein